MRRRSAVILVFVAALFSACAVGDPKPATYVTDVSATLNGDVYSNVEGDTKYWFVYGETNAYGSETPERTIAIDDGEAHPVSEPVAGLEPQTTYHFQMCVQDSGEDPPRDICSKEQTFATGPAGGRSGIALVRNTGSAGARDLHVVDEQGGDEQQLTFNSGWEESPSWSPAGRGIAYSTGGGISVVDSDGGGEPRHLPFGHSSGTWPDWSPDGSRFAYRGEFAEIWVVGTDGTGNQRLTTKLGDNIRPDWSPDGRRIAFVAHRDGNSEIYVINADGTGERRLTNHPGSDSFPAWSPDGRKIAFVTSRGDPTGAAKIYVMNSDGTNQTFLAHLPGGAGPLSWSPDGSRLAVATHRITVMDSDGTDQSSITPLGTPVFEVAWSPRP